MKRAVPFKPRYPPFIKKTVKRHKICVLLRCFRSKYTRYMSLKSALYLAQILCLLTLRAQTKRMSPFSRQTKEAYRGIRPFRITRKMKKLSRFEACSSLQTEGKQMLNNLSNSVSP